MRYVTSHGMTTGMTTNGFLLTEDRLKELIDAGMGRIQISRRRAEPEAGHAEVAQDAAQEDRDGRASTRSGSASTR